MAHRGGSLGLRAAVICQIHMEKSSIPHWSFWIQDWSRSWQRFCPIMTVFLKLSAKIANIWCCWMICSFISSNEFTFMPASFSHFRYHSFLMPSFSFWDGALLLYASCWMFICLTWEQGPRIQPAHPEKTMMMHGLLPWFGLFLRSSSCQHAAIWDNYLEWGLEICKRVNKVEYH